MLEWIYNLQADKIQFYTYKMKANDCFVYTNNSQIKKNIVVLQGIILILKIFTNGEKVCLGILNRNNILRIGLCKKYKSKYYYQAIALEESWILSFKYNHLCNISYTSLQMYLQAYNKTIAQAEIINQILIHKEIKSRLIQLIIFLSEEFGYIQSKYITFSFDISQTTLAIIVGSNKFTINKILKSLNNNLIIKSHRKNYLYILLNQVIT